MSTDFFAVPAPAALREYDEVRSYDMGGVAFLLKRDAGCRYWTWEVRVDGTVVDTGASYGTGHFDCAEAALADMCPHVQPPRAYREAWNADRTASAAYFAHWRRTSRQPVTWGREARASTTVGPLPLDDVKGAPEVSVPVSDLVDLFTEGGLSGRAEADETGMLWLYATMPDAGGTLFNLVPLDPDGPGLGAWELEQAAEEVRGYARALARDGDPAAAEECARWAAALERAARGARDGATEGPGE